MFLRPEEIFSFWIHKAFYVTRNPLEKCQDIRETRPQNLSIEEIFNNELNFWDNIFTSQLPGLFLLKS